MTTNKNKSHSMKDKAIAELIENNQKQLREHIEVVSVASCCLCNVTHPSDCLDKWLCCPTCIKRGRTQNTCQE